MSGCCGQGPVIVSGATPTPRVDVEGTVLCDVLPDGSVAGTALVEGIYDTVSGDRVGTRTVDPATGDPYTPTGTLQPCPTSPDCESPTTPVTSVGLCLADGTPIAVTVIRDCEGTVTSEGWLNLSTGAYSAGAPPAGTVACGDSRSVQVSGTFCDVDGDGLVVGLVLIEYTYDDEGAISAVRLVDATTGDTYTPTGTITTCPAGVEQPEQDVVQLCDVAPDGTRTPFLRDYRRDELGAITGHTDYLLDGTPYAPTGTVGTCKPCRETSTQLLCDVAPFDPSTVSLRAADPATETSAATQYPGLVWQDAAPASVEAVLAGGSASWGNPAGLAGPQHHFVWGGFGFSLPDPPACGAYEDMGDVQLGMSVTVRNDGPGPGVGADGVLALFSGGVYVGAQPVPNGLAAGATATITLTTTTHAVADLGEVVAVLALEILEGTAAKTWTVSDLTYTLTPVDGSGAAPGCGPQFIRTYVRDCATGELVETVDADLDGNPYTATGPVAVCEPANTDTSPCETAGVQTVRLCDLDPTSEPDEDGRRCAIPFLRHLAYDCAGALLGFHDTGLDGTTPYTPTQVVDCQCTSGEGVTSSIEVPWTTISVVEDPAGLPQQDFIYTVAPENDPTRIGTIRVHVSRPAGGACGAYDISNLVFSNTATYTLTLDAVAREMSYLRVDLLDFDTFEPVGISSGSTEPDRLGGTAGWNPAHTRIVPAENNGVGYMYWDNPPETIAWTVFNQGGGTSCGALSFQGMTVEPGGCCGGDTGCGDTEVVQLCDLTYSPQAPIPVPASAWTLAGSLSVYGDLLVFSGGDSPVTGIAERALTGLLGGGAYELRYDAGWYGTGWPNGSGNGDAVYRLEVLDGLTVIATREENLSNGAGTAGPVTPQPPLPFTAPTSGNVTVRITDVSTGTINRDVVIRPLTVQTEDLQTTATPFLRSVTFDCAGAATATSDLALDGTTPYEVQGDVTSCGSAGTGTVTAVETCARQIIERCGCDDTDGDGIADESYTELWAVDPCGGEAPELVGTFLDGDLTQPYTPVAPVACEGAEALTGEPVLLCDDGTPFLRHVRYNGAGAPVGVLDTETDGATPYTVTGTVGTCAPGAAPDAPVSTGLNRLTAAGTFDVKATAPGVQSATVTVLAGTAAVTTSSGTVTIPAGLSLTWSVTDTDDSSLDVLSVTAPAGADVVTNYTYKSGAAG